MFTNVSDRHSEYIPHLDWSNNSRVLHHHPAPQRSADYALKSVMEVVPALLCMSGYQSVDRKLPGTTKHALHFIVSLVPTVCLSGRKFLCVTLSLFWIILVVFGLFRKFRILRF